jgi:hypothetical protein
MNSLLAVKHYIHNYTKTRQEEMLHVIVSSFIEYLAVEEEIFHGRSMTSVANISRNSRINWPGNSVYLYQSASSPTTHTRTSMSVAVVLLQNLNVAVTRITPPPRARKTSPCLRMTLLRRQK